MAPPRKAIDEAARVAAAVLSAGGTNGQASLRSGMSVRSIQRLRASNPAYDRLCRDGLPDVVTTVGPGEPREPDPIEDAVARATAPASAAEPNRAWVRMPEGRVIGSRTSDPEDGVVLAFVDDDAEERRVVSELTAGRRP